jgi:hypothetical protein
MTLPNRPLSAASQATPSFSRNEFIALVVAKLGRKIAQHEWSIVEKYYSRCWELCGQIAPVQTLTRQETAELTQQVSVNILIQCVASLNGATTSVAVLEYWFSRHLDNPYPTIKERELLARQSRMTDKQVLTWFTNKRARSKALQAAQ